MNIKKSWIREIAALSYKKKKKKIVIDKAVIIMVFCKEKNLYDFD